MVNFPEEIFSLHIYIADVPLATPVLSSGGWDDSKWATRSTITVPRAQRLSCWRTARVGAR